MDRESKASKMFIISLSVLGNQKQVQDKSINGHLTGVTKKKRFYWLTKTIALYKSSLLKVKSLCECAKSKVCLAVKAKTTVKF